MSSPPKTLKNSGVTITPKLWAIRARLVRIYRCRHLEESQWYYCGNWGHAIPYRKVQLSSYSAFQSSSNAGAGTRRRRPAESPTSSSICTSKAQPTGPETTSSYRSKTSVATWTRILHVKTPLTWWRSSGRTSSEPSKSLEICSPTHCTAGRMWTMNVAPSIGSCSKRGRRNLWRRPSKSRTEESSRDSR